MTENNKFDEFDPINQLEEDLLATSRGEMDNITFLQKLAESSVSILIDKEFVETENPEGVQPLILEASNGEPLLALFSAPARGYPMTEQHPEHAFAVEVAFPWAVHNAWNGMGLVINPGWSVGLTIPPASVEQMKGNQPKLS